VEECSAAAAPRSRPPLEVGDVARAHGDALRQRHPLTLDQERVLRDLSTCRTAVRGGHVDVCPKCDYWRPAYNSCRNRHCPKCQALSQARWLEERMERVLPTHYFHVVFTLPAELRPLCRRNPARMYGLLFASASATLLALGCDPARLGAQLGFTAVLHTWTRSLDYHPHLHCIVTGGGLTDDGARWVPARRKYLFPLAVMGALFRGKLLAGVRRLRDEDKLDLGGASPEEFAGLVDLLYGKKWIVYAKRPFGGPEQVYRYLGRYTHRVGISNDRLIALDERGLSFATKDGKTITLAPVEFLRRFLMHVLPRGFTKIRHYGLMGATNAGTRLETARGLLGPTAPPARPTRPTWIERLLALTGIDRSLCPRCQAGLLTLPLAFLGQPAPAAPDTS